MVWSCWGCWSQIPATVFVEYLFIVHYSSCFWCLFWSTVGVRKNCCNHFILTQELSIRSVLWESLCVCRVYDIIHTKYYAKPFDLLYNLPEYLKQLHIKRNNIFILFLWSLICSSPYRIRVRYFFIINGTLPPRFSFIHTYTINFHARFKIIQMVIHVREGEIQM